MKVRWNKVTWYSKLLALILFVAMPFAGFGLGLKYGYHWANYRISTYLAARQGVFLAGLDRSRAQLIEAKTRLAISGVWDIPPQDVFRDPERPSRFYFAIPQASPSDGAAIAMYDLAGDDTFGKYEEARPRLENYSVSYLLKHSLPENMEFRIAGIRGTELIFRESLKVETLGKCASFWLYQDLQSIDVTRGGSVRKPYFLSEKELLAVQEEAMDCMEKKGGRE